MSTTTSSIPTLTGISFFNSFSSTFSAFGVNTKWSKNCVKSRISRYRLCIATHKSPHERSSGTDPLPATFSAHSHPRRGSSDLLKESHCHSSHIRSSPASFSAWYQDRLRHSPFWADLPRSHLQRSLPVHISLAVPPLPFLRKILH